ncbi:hypothetical protein AVEN_244716-1 [Araneus ventricosus]|uniref:Uncharacterized protein n=1 Tax=Araneus ventricosus TaxID=182803 RepID=A0A4Y2BRQ0_ARAVE|nr:hypothetical protein AVEN_244716-1 [Araneus ventricosus]
MTTGSGDLQATQRLQKTVARKARNQALEKARLGKFQLEEMKPPEILGEENVKVCNSNDFAFVKNTPSCFTLQTRLKLATFARSCDRYGVAYRPDAALASALLHDLSSEKNERSKVRRERPKSRHNFYEQIPRE